MNASWTPDTRQVVYAVQNREQYWLDLNVAPLDGGSSKTLLRETTKAWVNENGPPTWLKDGSFLWIFGEQELRDVEDGLAWLKKQPWVDASRIGIDGWSFGGFMVTYALTHSPGFAMGIAGGSVTDWSLYDTVYTVENLVKPGEARPGDLSRRSSRRQLRSEGGRNALKGSRGQLRSLSRPRMRPSA